MQIVETFHNIQKTPNSGNDAKKIFNEPFFVFHKTRLKRDHFVELYNHFGMSNIKIFYNGDNI